MTAKRFSAASLLTAGITTLSAQATTVAFRKSGMEDTDFSAPISLLTQHAFMVLLGFVVFLGITWLACIGSACADLSKKQKGSRTCFTFMLLCLAMALSTLGSSCTSAQQAQAVDIRMAQEMEGRFCVCHAPLNNPQYSGYAGVYNQPFRKGGSGKAFCRQCGWCVQDHNR
ncbi:MAG TPA: hypothetical protein PKD78_15845 [Saprospiraceae bacterium]|nr:hypothetical protein [Saprospiraceae bacterium]